MHRSFQQRPSDEGARPSRWRSTQLTVGRPLADPPVRQSGGGPRHLAKLGSRD